MTETPALDAALYIGCLGIATMFLLLLYFLYGMSRRIEATEKRIDDAVFNLETLESVARMNVDALADCKTRLRALETSDASRYPKGRVMT